MPKFSGKKIFGQAGVYSVIMKSIPLPIVEFNRCQKQLQDERLGPQFRLDQSFICAGGVEGIDTCEVCESSFQSKFQLSFINFFSSSSYE